MTHTRFILADGKNSVNVLNFYFRGTEQGWPCDAFTLLLLIVSHTTVIVVP